MAASSSSPSSRSSLSRVEHVLSLVTNGITMVFPFLTLPSGQDEVGGRKPHGKF